MHHQFFGLFIDEWASLVAIGGGLGTAIALIMRAVLLPLKNSIDNLNQTIKALGDSTNRVKITLTELINLKTVLKSILVKPKYVTIE